MSADGIWLAAGAVAVGVVVFGFAAFARIRSNQLDRMVLHREAFFKAAQNLLSDDDTPEVIVDQLEFMSRHIDRGLMGRIFLLIGLWGALSKSFTDGDKNLRDFRRTVDEMRPEMRKQYALSAINCLLASTYCNVLIGFFIRRVMLYWLPRDGSDAPKVGILLRDVIVAYQDRRISRHAAALGAC